MCGITGFISASPRQADKSHYILKQMSDRLVHRGPDSAGTWVSEDKKVALAHRRLAILDLSPAGHQPILGSRFCLTFNGEIYNFKRIKEELCKLGAHFNGHSDTEVLLQALEFWGIDKTLNQVEGMFAFAAYDLREAKLYLARDRMGEKPLYYSQRPNDFIFGSELKAFNQHPGWSPEIDHNALTLYFKHNCIPAPYSIYKDTCKLKPGHYLRVNVDDLDIKETCYWSMAEKFAAGHKTPFDGTAQEASQQLEQLLTASIRDQIVADVPLGSFLSGGIDSSAVTAVMQGQSTNPINTYSIGFNFHDFNEAVFAKEIAQHLGTSHTEFYVSEQDAKDVIPELPEIYDEPFADSSQIPTYLVCKLAKQQVTVALSGDGGDELFAGYSRYDQILNSWAKKHNTKGKLSSLALNALAKAPSTLVENTLGPVLKLQGQYSEQVSLRLRARNHIQKSRSLPEYYRKSIEFWHSKSNLLLSNNNPIYALNAPQLNCNDVSPLALLQYLDTKMYLPDDILAKVDRAGMAVSLETRIPLLNHKIVEFAVTLPDEIKTHNGKTKWPLQDVLSRHVPTQLFDRPKQGFAIPIGEWLRGPLNSWMMDLLSHEKIKSQGLFNYDAISPIITMHMNGNGDHSPKLWSLLMFQAWYDNTYTPMTKEAAA